jgi:hypothetical protein
LSRTLNRQLSVLDLFVYPTIHALVAKLFDQHHSEQDALDVARDRAVKQRDAIRRRRLATNAHEVVR